MADLLAGAAAAVDGADPGRAQELGQRFGAHVVERAEPEDRHPVPLRMSPRAPRRRASGGASQGAFEPRRLGFEVDARLEADPDLGASGVHLSGCPNGAAQAEDLLLQRFEAVAGDVAGAGGRSGGIGDGQLRVARLRRPVDGQVRQSQARRGGGRRPRSGRGLITPGGTLQTPSRRKEHPRAPGASGWIRGWRVMRRPAVAGTGRGGLPDGVDPQQRREDGAAPSARRGADGASAPQPDGTGGGDPWARSTAPFHPRVYLRRISPSDARTHSPRRRCRPAPPGDRSSQLRAARGWKAGSAGEARLSVKAWRTRRPGPRPRPRSERASIVCPRSFDQAESRGYGVKGWRAARPSRLLRRREGDLQPAAQAPPAEAGLRLRLTVGRAPDRGDGGGRAWAGAGERGRGCSGHPGGAARGDGSPSSSGRTSRASVLLPKARGRSRRCARPRPAAGGSSPAPAARASLRAAKRRRRSASPPVETAVLDRQWLQVRDLEGVLPRTVIATHPGRRDPLARPAVSTAAPSGPSRRRQARLLGAWRDRGGEPWAASGAPGA
jgi:hypothetical protein